MEEILTSKRLKREGVTMHHCAYSYEHSILAGSCSLWSLYPESEDIEHRVTIEVSKRKIVQVRGLQNKAVGGSLQDSHQVGKPEYIES